MEAALTSVLGRTMLGNRTFTIGRALDNELVIRDRSVSKHHAEVRPDLQGYSIVDLESSNGTFVNEIRLIGGVPLRLRSGDICRLGSFTLTYEEYFPTLRDSTGAIRSVDPPADIEEDYSWQEDHERSQNKDWTLPSPGSQALPDEDWRDQNPPSRWGQPSSPYAVPPPEIGAPPPLQPGPAGAPPPPYSGPAVPSKEYLQFTAFHPRTVPVETWSALLIYAYVESALRAVRADANTFKEQLGPNPSNVDTWAEQPLARGGQITIVPAFQGVTFNPERITFDWTKDWHRAFFSFNADKRWAGSIGNGEVTVFSGPIIIASFKISLRFSEQSSSGSDADIEVGAYRYRKIFTSYSHDDTPIVLAIRKAYEVIGDDSLLDREDLKSGQDWNAELLRMIDNADLFQLFWSQRSARSPYVAQEWQYALQHYKYDGFIRPVYWEKPMTRVPKELSHLHFAYYELAQAQANTRHAFRLNFSSLFGRR